MTTPACLERQHTLATAVARYDELCMRDLLAPGADDLPPDERPGPGPLSRQEALELLALSEVIARKAGYRRQIGLFSADKHRRGMNPQVISAQTARSCGCLAHYRAACMTHFAG